MPPKKRSKNTPKSVPKPKKVNTTTSEEILSGGGVGVNELNKPGTPRQPSSSSHGKIFRESRQKRGCSSLSSQDESSNKRMKSPPESSQNAAASQLQHTVNTKGITIIMIIIIQRPVVGRL